MAGGALKPDFAIERFNRLREEAYQRFRWTRYTVRTTLIGVVLFPALTYYLMSNQDAKWDWVAKRKGESLLRVPPKQSEEE